VLAITDQSGTIVAEYSYDAWGNILSQSGDLADINPLRYAGYYYDDETKFYYLMNRYYNPDSGVFISLDPEFGSLYDPISQNGYIYADNNPVMLIDITGDEAIAAGIAISYILASGGATYMVVEAVKKIDEIGQDISGFLAANKKAKAPTRKKDGTTKVPQKARDVAKEVLKNKGTPPKGYKGGKSYKNQPQNGGQKLPERVQYKEYDINPNVKGVDRGAERIVIGNDGSVWYTSDHYYTFIQIQ
jgi:RHS repeat-associated protein